ncbi:hypothetical protein P43SY_005513 [Pythium insidiosum]|uniref:Methyltransferase n=1 Tax=Pythium insidiosum TaxID=114742 RepID=A0AAD5Q8T5_PYTIN|nr:hypothetical protein P43SY_005513 [Pythium insidiosum]
MSQPSPDAILQVGMGFFASRTLLVAVEMQLFTLLAAQPLTAQELEAKLQLHARSSRDFLDALVALGFLQRSQDGRYANTRDTDFFLDRNKPSYLGGIMEMASSRLFRFWNDLPTALRTGLPQNESKTGEGTFEALYSDPQRLKEFLAAMSGISRGANMTIARKFPWKDFKSCADIGTAQGDLVCQVALANPHIRGIGFDLPPVGPIFTEYAASHKLSDRVTFEAGSFFDVPLPTADVLMFGHILHDWDLATKKMLIKKSFEALPSGGAILIYESLIDDERSTNAFGLLMSLNMLIETSGGFDYTGRDCIAWLTEAGFRDCRVEHLVGPDSMVVAFKP